MGTNYYVSSHFGEKRHIGKSSAGWCFSLHVYPEEGINNIEDWLKVLAGDSAYCIDEYDKVLTVLTVLRTIINRSRSGRLHSDQFFNENNAEPSPKGLLRHRIDGEFCIGHGAGTYDYMIGDFS